MTNFKPLLAGKAPDDLSTLRYPVLASPKLDGIRCVKLDGKALTRSLKPIPNRYVREWIEQNLPDGIDGELMLRDHRRPFAEVTSAIMSEDGEPNFVYNVFDFRIDWPKDRAPFGERIWALESYFKRYNLRHLQVVPHIMCMDYADLQALVYSHLDLGYEGTMVRDPAGDYKFGRSTVKEGILLKIKAFADDEATIVGAFEEMANTNEAKRDALGNVERSSAKAGKVGKGTLGGFHCRMADGTEFDLGAGFTAVQRAELWAGTSGIFRDGNGGVLGRLVKFKHQPPPGGRKAGEAPRFPVFLGFRDARDIGGEADVG